MSDGITSTIEWTQAHGTPAGPAVRMGDLLISRVAAPVTRGYGKYWSVWREAEGGWEIAHRVESGHPRAQGTPNGTLAFSPWCRTRAEATLLAYAAAKASDDCRACGGLGVRFGHVTCVPCMGTGKRPAEAAPRITLTDAELYARVQSVIADRERRAGRHVRTARTSAFAQVAQELGVRPGIVATRYYRHEPTADAAARIAQAAELRGEEPAPAVGRWHLEHRPEEARRYAAGECEHGVNPTRDRATCNECEGRRLELEAAYEEQGFECEAERRNEEALYGNREARLAHLEGAAMARELS